jgi:hypothetical protein
VAWPLELRSQAFNVASDAWYLREMHGRKPGARRYYAYDVLQRKEPETHRVTPSFREREFDRLWRDIFAFAFA